LEVVTWRREDVDDHSAVRACRRPVGRVRRDAPRSAWAEPAALVSNAELHRARENRAELLVIVAVLADDRPGIELDHRQRDALAVNGPGRDPLPDLPGSDRGELVEGAQRPRPRRKMWLSPVPSSDKVVCVPVRPTLTRAPRRPKLRLLRPRLPMFALTPGRSCLRR
jgi:hypothetical protein